MAKGILPPSSNNADQLCAWAFRVAWLAFFTALLGVGQANGIVPKLSSGQATAAAVTGQVTP